MKHKIKNSPKGLVEFLESTIDNFFIELERLQKLSKQTWRFDISEYGEIFLMSLFANAISLHDPERKYLLFQEMEVNDPKNKNSFGRIDLIIEDKINKSIYIIEGKTCWSTDNYPNTQNWKEPSTRQFYDNVLARQLEKYFNFIESQVEYFTQKYLIILVFDRVKFDALENLKLWDYDDLMEDEFYDFHPFIFKNKYEVRGLAVYGYVKEKITSHYD